MARKENTSSKWIKSERVGSIALHLTRRSPFWCMYWVEDDRDHPEWPKRNSLRPRERRQSTRETDLSLARAVATKKNEELFRLKQFPELKKPAERRDPVRKVVADFVEYLHGLDRSHDYVRNIAGRLGFLATWMEQARLSCVQEITPSLLLRFGQHLKVKQRLKASTVNDYVDAVHCFFGYVIFKRQLMPGPNPAATGRQAVLDRLPVNTTPPPTIYPEQVNRIIETALRNGDHQIVNMVVFVCEGGFRFQELQFLQVGDIDLSRHEIILDVKKPDLSRVRPELQKRCLTSEGMWIPKTRAGRRPIHVTDRMAKVIQSMGLGEATDWVFMNQAGKQVAENKTLLRLKDHALEAGVLVADHPKGEGRWSLIRWHWLRHYHRTRAHVCKIRREVSKVAMGHAADSIHDHYRGLDAFAFHEEYAKFDSGIDDALLT